MSQNSNGTGVPEVSIIMTTYNCESNLEKTLKAIEQQDYPNLEIIIKDGASTDQTVQIIKEFGQKSKHTVRWISNHDKGIYDAMNQGYKLSSGKIIVFCSDRLYDSNVVSTMVAAIEGGGISCVGAHADLVYAENDRIKRFWKMGDGNIQSGWMPGHPTLYLKREVLEKYGLYHTDYRIAADYELMIRILKHTENKLVYVPKVIVSMYYGGTSTQGLASYILSLKESERALRENDIPNPWLVNLKRMCRLMRQFSDAK